MADFQTIVLMFDYLNDNPVVAYGYMQDTVIYEEYKGIYVSQSDKMIYKNMFRIMV